MGLLPPPSAVLLDLDGTLVEVGADAHRGLAAGAGRSLDADQAVRADARHGEIYELLDTDPTPLPSVAELTDLLQRPSD